MYSLGLMYLNGKGVSRDLVKAFYLFMEAYNLGHDEAYEVLILLKYSESLKMLESVANLGAVAIQYQLGEFYKNKNHLQSFKWFTLAAEGGITDSYYKLGRLYEHGEGIHRDCSKAIASYEKAIEKDHEEALYRLAELYLLGGKIECDYLRAYNLYSRAAKLGHIEAFKLLNDIWDTNVNISETNQENAFDISSKRLSKAVQMFRFVAEDGNADLQYQLGSFYERNEYNKDYPEAFKWYRKAANNDHLEAIYHLGLFYEKGLGVTRDYSKAIQLYNQAKDHGSHDALYRLGVIFHHGYGVKINHTKAICFYEEAASLGNSQSRYTLGRLYESGDLLQYDILKVLEWYTKAYLNANNSNIPELYNLYEHEPYEYFFHKKRFETLSKLENSYKSDNCDYYESYGYIYYKLGKIYLDGIGTNKNNAKALKQFLKAYYDYSYKDAKPFITLDYNKSHYSNITTFIEMLNGYKEIQDFIPSQHLYELGMLYYNGYSTNKTNLNNSKSTIVPKNYSIAIQYFKLVSKEMLTEASQQLGIIYYESNDIDQAIVWFSKAAETLDYEECYKIGMEYYLEKKYEISFAYLKKAAESNHARALEKLIMMYLQGFGVEKNVDETMLLIDKSLQVMGPYECYDQGMKFYNGSGADINYDISLVYLRKAAERDDSDALEQLIMMYLQGKGVERNINETMLLIDKSLQVMGPYECYNQGMKFYKGSGVYVNYDISLMYLRKAAEGYDSDALEQLVMMYLQGEGVEKSIYEAMVLIEKLVQVTSSDKCYAKGMEFYYGSGVDVNYNISLMYLRKAAKTNDGRALAQLGAMYLQGHGVEKNTDEAMVFLEKSLQLMSPHECYYQAMKFYEGSGVDINYEILLIYLQKAAEKNHTYTQARLGYMYLNGIVVDKDDEQAKRWYDKIECEYFRKPSLCIGLVYHYDCNGIQDFSKALECYQKQLSDCERNRPILYRVDSCISSAIRGIGLLYEYGDGVDQDYEKALELYRESASHGNIGAYYNLGLMYYYGRGVDQNYKQALKWFKRINKSTISDHNMHVFIQDKDAEIGNLDKPADCEYSLQSSDIIYGEAQYYLGLMYKNGYGVPKDNSRSQQYFKASFALGIKHANNFIYQLQSGKIGILISTLENGRKWATKFLKSWL